MGSIDIIKPLSAVLSSAVNKSQQLQDKNSWEHLDLTRAAGWEAGMLPLCYAVPPPEKKFVTCLGGIEGLREKLDAEIARSIIAQENIAIVESEVDAVDGELRPALPDHVSSAFIKATTYERFDVANGYEQAGIEGNQEADSLLQSLATFDTKSPFYSSPSLE